MAVLNDIIKLDNYEDMDIFDVIVKLEKSFGLKFEKDAFYHVKTFGDLCDVFENHITFEHLEDCTKQQAFYRVRNAIVMTQNIDSSKIKLDTKLADLFPSRNRIEKTKQFKSYLRTDIDILTYPGWVATTFFIGLLSSLVVFFISWKIALAGIAFFIIFIKIARIFGKDLDIRTVRELTEKLSRENYIDIRRTSNTVNRKEILQTIIDSFNHDLGIDKIYLTREEKFSWSL
ncbi:MAG TPA: hypothetical protein VF476_08300 [Chitinophagaceae bacterium]